MARRVPLADLKKAPPGEVVDVADRLAHEERGRRRKIGIRDVAGLAFIPSRVAGRGRGLRPYAGVPLVAVADDRCLIVASPVLGWIAWMDDWMFGA